MHHRPTLLIHIRVCRVPCLEFASSDIAYVSNENTVRMGAVSCVSHRALLAVKYALYQLLIGHCAATIRHSVE
jgi:hypothetical protein